MKTEFEVKFINIDHDTFRSKLKALNADLLQPMRLMKRAIIQTPELRGRGGFIRIRDEGDKITLTYKQFDSLSIDGAKEYTIVVDDFDSTLNILKQAGLTHGSIQESKRETWVYDNAEIVLDEWPWLNPYVEIEGYGEQHVQDISEQLGFEWSDAVFGDVMAAYRQQYSHLTEKDTIANLSEVKFNDPLPDLLIAK